MAYFCKNCGLPVDVAHKKGVLIMSIEENGKTKELDSCPQCGNRFMTQNDLKFIREKEAIK